MAHPDHRYAFVREESLYVETYEDSYDPRFARDLKEGIRVAKSRERYCYSIYIYLYLFYSIYIILILLLYTINDMAMNAADIRYLFLLTGDAFVFARRVNFCP